MKATVDRLRVVRELIGLVPSDDLVAGFTDQAQLSRLGSYLGEVGADDLEVKGIAYGQGGLGITAKGAEGLIEFWREWLTPWTSFALEVGQVLEGPRGGHDRVGSRGLFGGDRLARLEFHLDRDAARMAAGL